MIGPMRIACALLFLVLLGAPASAGPALDLAEARRRAAESSPRLREARSRVAEAGYRVDEAFAPAWPSLRLEAGYAHVDPEIEVALGPRPVQVVAADNYRVGLGLQQEILTFGRLGWATEAAGLSRQAAESELRAAEQALWEETGLRYRDALSALQAVEVAEDSLEAARAQLRDSENLVDQGVAAPFDVVRSRSEVLEAEQALLEARARRETTHLRLAVLLGLPSDPPLELAPAPEVPPPPEGTGDAVAEAFRRRPELAALRLGAEAAEARVRLAASQDNPSLRLTSEYQRRNATGFTRDFQWSTGLQLQVPLFDGGLTAARVGQAEEVARQARARLEEAERAIRIEVERTLLELRTAWNQVRVARQKVQELTEARRLANLRYQNGLSTQVERLEAETAWTRARFGLVRSELDYASTWTRWVRVAALPEGAQP